jgi:NodT family efflux transporter outer membrane factor (OMF) lipoprotein
LGLLIFVISGCALSKPPSHSQVVTNALPQGTTIPSAWIAGGTTNDVANDWLKSFNDPRLDALVAEAIANNLDLRAAAERVEIARQSVVVVGAQMKPQIGIDLGLRATRDDGHNDWFTSKGGLAGAAWEPDVWGKLRAQRAAAEAGYQATALDYAFARQSLAATTAKSWYLATEAIQLLSLSEQSVQIYSQLLDLVKLRRTAGKVSDLDVAEASGNLNAAENQLRQTRGMASEAKRNLVLVGRYPGAELKVAENFTPVPPPVQTGLPSSLLERRPDLVAAAQQVLAAFRQTEAARLALLPSFSLNLDGGKLSDNLLSVLQVNPWMFSAAVGMYVRIYTGGALRAQIKIATAGQLEAVSAYGGAALRAFREVENGLMNEGLLSQRLQFAQNVVRDNTEAVRIATLQYRAGSMDLLSLLQLQEAQIRSQAEVIQLRNAQLANRINLHLALGGSFEVAPAVAPIVASQAAGGRRRASEPMTR